MDDVPSASPRRYLPLIVVAGVLANMIFFIVLRERWLAGLNDYMGFYSSGKLAFSGALYDVERHWQIQRAATGGFGEAWIFVRLPYYAIFLWPFARLPYPAAWALFGLASVAAFAAFIRFWPYPNKRELSLLLLASLPVCHSLINGQDVAFLLLWLALGTHLLLRNRPFAAGLVYCLLAAKPHLFLFLPLVFLLRRDWRCIAGMASGGLALFAISFAVAGPDWIGKFFQTIMRPGLHGWSQMPNVHLFFGEKAPTALIYALGIPAAIALLFGARRRPPPEIIALSILPAILLSPHVYLDDCALAIPYGLAALEKRPVSGFLLLSPIYFLLAFGPPGAYLVPAVLLFSCLPSD